MSARRSNRTKPRDPGHAVEVGIGTGKVGNAVDMHNCDSECVVVQKASLLADGGGSIQPSWIDGQNADAEKRDFLNGLTKAFQGLHLGRMVAKTEGDAGRLPAERLHRFDRHQSMGDLADDVRGGKTVNLLVFDAFEELGGGRSKSGVRLKMVDEDAGIQKDGCAGGQVGIDHASSCGSSSGLRATKSASSWLPVQPIKPADCRTRLAAAFTVTWTFSCSLRGNGSAGLST